MRTEDYSARFTVLRGGEKVELPCVRFDTWQDDSGETHMSLGFTVYGIRKTPANVVKEAWNSVLYYGRIIFTSLMDLLRGRESINDLSGPVGIVTAIGQAASYGWQDLLQLLVLITVNLASSTCCPSRHWTAARWCSCSSRALRACSAGKDPERADAGGVRAALWPDALRNIQ